MVLNCDKIGRIKPRPLLSACVLLNPTSAFLGETDQFEPVQARGRHDCSGRGHSESAGSESQMTALTIRPPSVSSVSDSSSLITFPSSSRHTGICTSRWTVQSLSAKLTISPINGTRANSIGLVYDSPSNENFAYTHAKPVAVWAQGTADWVIDFSFRGAVSIGGLTVATGSTELAETAAASSAKASAGRGGDSIAA